MIDAIKRFKANHENLFEFIMFNIMSNIATIVNFVVLNIGINFLFKSLRNTDFIFFLFDYRVENGGLGGFLSFLLSYFCAQTVNFIVQRNIVFKSNNKSKIAIPIYILTVIAVYVIIMYVPSFTLKPLTALFGDIWGINITNLINIIIQVIIIYPVLKFVVLKKDTPKSTAE